MRNRVVLLVVLLLVSCGLAMAQETTTGSLAGVVVDTQGNPVPGATVTVTSGQGSKVFTTDTSGRFLAPFLTPGVYSVKVELSGFSAAEQKNIDVRLGQRLELKQLVLKVGAVTETIQVVGESPVIDTSSTTVGGTLDTATLQKLPVGRNFTDTLYLVPGVSSSGGVGQANPSVSGASGLENQYIVDGVNITNAGYGGVGSYSIIFGSLGSGVTTDFIKETQVKTAGFEAEYGQSTGGVVNVVTQSGTNSFHGGVFGYFRPNGIEASWKKASSPNGTVNTTGTDNYDFGVNLGAPLIKDKLFFFGTFNPQYQTRTFVAPPDFPLADRGGIDRKRHIMSYAGKLTWQLNANHRFDVSAFGDPAKGDMGPQRFSSMVADADSFSSITYGGHNQVVKYDGILSRSWLIEASWAHATNKIAETPAVDTWRVTDTTVTPNVITGGIGFYEQGNDGKNNQYQFKSTNMFKGAGSHEVRYGVQYEDINYTNINQRTGPTFTTPDGTPTATGASISVLPDPVYGRIYRVTRANLNSGRTTTQRYLSFFAQDTWQMGRLTLRPGLRYEQQKLVGPEPGNGIRSSATRVTRSPVEATAPVPGLPATSSGPETGPPASVRPTISGATAGRSSSRAMAGSTPRSRTISPPEPWGPMPASPAPTTSTRTSPTPCPTASRRPGSRTTTSSPGSGRPRSPRIRSRATSRSGWAASRWPWEATSTWVSATSTARCPGSSRTTSRPPWWPSTWAARVPRPSST
jgi:hypothetical protein